MKKFVRLGGGSAGSEERVDPALEMVEKGNLDYICFDSLSESELSLIAANHRQNPDSKKYCVFAEYRLRAMLPACAKHGVKLIGNMGAGDPLAAQELAISIAKELGLKGLKIAAVYGDNLVDTIQDMHLKTVETGVDIADFGTDLVSANAYMPCDGIVAALKEGADVVLTGRVGDAALFLAPLMYEFGWTNEDLDQKARGIIVGHLLECGAQCSGGFYADPPYKVVPDMHKLGFPIAEVYPDGNFLITKVDGSGGLVSKDTCYEQMMYETHDPENYIEADVISDFKHIEFTDIAPNVAKMTGVIKGKKEPAKLKVSLGVLEGYLGSGTVYYGGPGALGRAKLAKEMLEKRFEYLGFDTENILVSLLGIDGLYMNAPGVPKDIEPWEVGVRTAIRTRKIEDAVFVAREGSTTLSNNGPASVSCKQRQYELKEIVGYYHTFINRELIKPQYCVKEV